MDEVVVEVLRVHIVGLAARAEVALPKEVNVHLLRERDPHSNVKLAVVHEERPLDVFLDDE